MMRTRDYMKTLNVSETSLLIENRKRVIGIRGEDEL